VTVRSLPDFPWDSLAPYKERASSVSGGIVDLSVGTPVDPTPAVVQEALRGAADAPGYPLTYGTAPLREAVAGWFARFPARTESREDAYLLDPRLRGLSVKIRGGGALDVKVYCGSLGILEVAGRARGRMQAPAHQPVLARQRTA